MLNLTKENKPFLVIDKHLYKDHYVASNINESVFIHDKKLKKSFKYNSGANVECGSEIYKDLGVKKRINLKGSDDTFNEVEIIGFFNRRIISKSTLTGMYYITNGLNFPGMKVLLT